MQVPPGNLLCYLPRPPNCSITTSVAVIVSAVASGSIHWPVWACGVWTFWTQVVNSGELNPSSAVSCAVALIRLPFKRPYGTRFKHGLWFPAMNRWADFSSP